MTEMDLKLIKILTDHYWVKRDRMVNKLEHSGKTFLINSKKSTAH